MSEIAERVKVEIVLSDFALVDPGSGKGNIVGAGVAVLGFGNGLSTRFSLWIAILVPSALCPVEFPVEVQLVNADGSLVSFPGPEGQQNVRVAQIVQAEKPTAQIPTALRDHIGSRVQLVLDFGNGMPLAPGAAYEWQVRIDGDDARTWSYPFAVFGGLPGPVIG